MNIVRRFKTAFHSIGKKFSTLWDAVKWVLDKQVEKVEDTKETQTPNKVEEGTFLPLEKSRNPGQFIGALNKKSEDEFETFVDLCHLGLNLELVEESHEQDIKTFDTWIFWNGNRVKLEVKNTPSTKYGTIKGHISHAIKQGCELLFLDMRKSPITLDEIITIIKRYIGSRSSKALPIDVEIWLKDNGKIQRYIRKKDEKNGTHDM